jgi:serine phosphatase RsbU (regulator of sigma subunit)
MQPAGGKDRRRSSAVSLSVASSLPAVLESLSEIVAILSPRARLAVLSIGDDTITVLASSGSEPLAVGETHRLLQTDQLRRRLAEGPLIVGVDDEAVSEEGRELFERFRCKRAFVASLYDFGVTSELVFIDEPGGCIEFGEDERRLLSAAVSQIAVALENAVLRARAAKRERMFDTIARLGAVFSSVIDLQRVATQIVEYAALLLEMPAVVLLFRHEGAADFTVLAAEGVPSELSRLKVKPIELATLETGLSGELGVVIPSGDDPDSLFARLEEAGLTNMLAEPLVVGGERLRGVLLGLDRRRLEPSSDEREEFHLLALQAANAIWNAERHEAEAAARDEARRELDTTSLLLRAADLLAGTLDLAKVLARLTELAVEATGRSRVVVTRYDAERQVLTVESAVGLEGLKPGTTIPLDTLSHQVQDSIREKRSCVVDYDSAELPEIGRDRVEELRSRLSLSVPLVFKGEVIGNIGLDDPDVRRDFSRREIEVVEGLAAQAAVAIANARLFEQQRDIAELFQHALLALPDRVPGIRFAQAYRAASGVGLVGGDFYDVFEIERDRIGVMIGDISGKGLGAAVLTSLLKDTLRAHTVERDKTPAAILHLANEVVYRATRIEQFATVFFGFLDCADGTLVYANAGHTAGAVIGRGRAARRLVATGPVIGAFGDVSYRDQEVRLDPDETIFLYTDGLTEARRGAEQFGEERLFELLEGLTDIEPDELVGQVLEQCDAFTGGTLRDDLAIFALRLDT